VTNLRKRMLEELQRRNYSPATIRGYLHAVEHFAKHFGKSPDQLGPDELRSYQAYLLTERKLAVGSVVGRVAALRFFFVRTLKRRDFWEELPYPKDPKDRRRLPTVLSLDEVARLIDAAGNLMQRALLMTLYGTGMRRMEVSLLKVSDVDSRRMMIRVERGKGEHFDWQEEVGSGANPAGVIPRWSASGHHAMKVRMWLQRLPPRMQNAEEPNFHSEALWIGADFEHGCGAGFKQEMEERPLVLPDERYQFMGNAEHDVEVVHRQQFVLPVAQPLLPRVGLTLRAVAISA
jgi:integrase